jgi:hypothetical protein
LSVSGSQIIKKTLFDGLSATTPQQIAAFIDLSAKVGLHCALDEDLLQKFDSLCKRKESSIVVAVVNGLQTLAALRRPPAVKLLKQALTKSRTVRQAAVFCLSSVPALARECSRELIDLLRKGKPISSAAAAKALLEGHLNTNVLEISHRQLLEDCLGAWESFYRPGIQSRLMFRVPEVALTKLLESSLQSERVLGLRLLPWVGTSEMVALSALQKGMRETTPAIAKAALVALYSTPTVLPILSSSDIAHLFKLLKQTRELRIATYRVLGSVELGKEYTRRRMGCLTAANRTEIVEIFSACISQASRDAAWAKEVFAYLEKNLPDVETGLGDAASVSLNKSFVALLADVPGEIPNALSSRVLSYAVDYRVALELRTQSITVKGRPK